MLNKALFAILLIAAPVHAGKAPAQVEVPYSPNWGEQAGNLLENESFFRNYVEVRPAGEGEPISYLDDKTSKKIRLEYEIIMRRHEARKNYDLSSHEDEKSYFERVSEFGKYVLRHMFRFKVHEKLKKAEQNSKEIHSISKVSQNVEKMVQGNTSFKFHDNFKLGTKANIPSQWGRIWMKSIVIDGSFEVDFSELESTFDPFKASDERYKVSLGRDLKILDEMGVGLTRWRSDVVYGGTTSNLTASVSAAVFTDHLRMVFSKSRATDENRSNLPEGGEESVRLLFGIQF